MEQRMEAPSKQAMLTSGIDYVPRVPLVSLFDLSCPMCKHVIRSCPKSVSGRSMPNVNMDDPTWKSAVNYCCFLRLESYDSTTQQLAIRVYGPLTGTGVPEDLTKRGCCIEVEFTTPNAKLVDSTMNTGGNYLLVRCTCDFTISSSYVELVARIREGSSGTIVVQMKHRVIIRQDT